MLLSLPHIPDSVPFPLLFLVSYWERYKSLDFNFLLILIVYFSWLKWLLQQDREVSLLQLAVFCTEQLAFEL